MTIYGMTDVGCVRRQNEDAFGHCLLSPPPKRKGSRETPAEATLAVVSDGMGGANAGEVASSLAVATLLECVKGTKKKTAEGALREAIGRANTAVYKKACADPACAGMGCTVVAALAYEDSLVLLNVGDSRIYLSHDGRLLLLTHDHSYVQQLVDAGWMSEEQARHSEYKNVITRAVGTHERVEADIAVCKWEEGDRLLLCTDGLTGALEESDIQTLLSEQSPVEEIANSLIMAGLMHGADDNITALVLENIKEKHNA